MNNMQEYCIKIQIYTTPINCLILASEIKAQKNTHFSVSVILSPFLFYCYSEKFMPDIRRSLSSLELLT